MCVFHRNDGVSIWAASWDNGHFWHNIEGLAKRSSPVRSQYPLRAPSYMLRPKMRNVQRCGDPRKKKSDFRCGFRWAEAASAGYIRHARRPVMKGLWITNALTGIQPAKIYSLFYKLLAAGPKLRGLPRRFRKMSFQIQPPIVAVLDPAPVECNRELDALIAIFVESRVASTVLHAACEMNCKCRILLLGKSLVFRCSPTL